MLKKWYFVKLLLSFLIASAFSQPTSADTYQITFSGTLAPAPTNFTYTVGTGFTTDILVTWDSILFDYTTSYLNGFGLLGCFGSTEGQAAFAQLNNDSTCAIGNSDSWDAGVSARGFAELLLAGGIYLTAPCRRCPSTMDFQGSYKLTDLSVAVPESSSLILMVSGLLGLGVIVGTARYNRKSCRFLHEDART